MSTDIQKRWDWIITSMILENRLVSSVLLHMVKEPYPPIKTMGVSVSNDRITLLYNPAWVGRLTDPGLRYALTHEVLHVALQHCTTRQPPDRRSMSLYNMAADLAVNSLIVPTAACEMPTGGLLPESYELEPGLSMEQYVMLLRDLPETHVQDPLDDHGGWGESELIKDVVRDMVARLSQDPRAWGCLSGKAQNAILAAQVTQVPWHKQLRHAIGDMPVTQQEVTYTRPNSRYGWPYGGIRRRHVDRKLLGVDTSASISIDSLSIFLSEINRLSDIQPVDVQVFDAGLIGGVTPFSRRHGRYTFEGRGGTDYGPLMALAEQRRYQSLIILTDGMAGPVPHPQHVRDILWVIVGDKQPPVSYGRVIHIQSC